MNIVDRRESDLYLVSPNNDQNVKLRLANEDRWMLKFKILLDAEADGIELYEESQSLVYGFPIAAGLLVRAAELLDVKLREEPRGEIGSEDLLRYLAEASPPVCKVQVSKRRTQFQLDNGWLELAGVVFPRTKVESLSIHSTRLETVREELRALNPTSDLMVMNYVSACRLFGLDTGAP